MTWPCTKLHLLQRSGKKRDEAAQAETTSFYYDSPKQPASAGWEHFVPYSNSISPPCPQLIQIHLTYLVSQNPLSLTFLGVA